MTELLTAKTELPRTDEDLYGNITVVTLHMNQAHVTTLTEAEGRALNVIPRNYFLNSCHIVNKD